MILGTGSAVPKGKVKVTLKRGGLSLRQTVADAQGKFAFTELTEGDYEVTIESSGYQTYHRRVGLRYPGHEEERFSARLVPIESRSNPSSAQERVWQEAREFFDRGLRASQAGKHEEAAKHYAKAVSLAPSFVQAWNNLGGEYRLLERWREGEQALRRALTLDPESSQAHFNLGMLFLAQGKVAQARHNLEEAVKKEPQLAAPHFLLGVIAYQKREMQVATREFRRALELAPEATPEAKVYLGSILARQGNFLEATRQLEDFLEKNPRHSQAAQAEQLLQEIRRFQPRAKEP